jgi:hypothetical protein
MYMSALTAIRCDPVSTACYQRNRDHVLTADSGRVKAHLHTAFAELGINSRAELSKLMHGADQTTAPTERTE